MELVRLSLLKQYFISYVYFSHRLFNILLNMIMKDVLSSNMQI